MMTYFISETLNLKYCIHQDILPGGISLYCQEENMVFTGDTLFRGSWGRTDLPTGSFEAIINSIETKLMPLPGDTIVYPGHGKSTMIKDEEPIYLELKGKPY